MSKKGTVLIDLSMMTKNSIFSMNIYACRLINGLYKLNPSYKICVLVPDGLDLSSVIPNDIDKIYLPKKGSLVLKIVYKIISKITGTNSAPYKRTINKFSPDIFLTAYSGTSAPYAKVKPYKIQVVHDVYAKYVNSGWNKYRQYITIPLRLKNCSSIVGISQYEIGQIKKEYSNIIKDKPIHLIYNSVEVSDAVSSVDNLDSAYILYVGALTEYKNVITLIKAYELIRDKYEVKLVIVGRKTAYYNQHLAPYIKEHNLENDVVLLSGVSETQLNYLYKNAKCFVTPSLREGFGYTPIEAIMHKCPVIISQETALPEVTEYKTESYSNAMDEVELSKKIAKVLDNPMTDAKLEELALYFRKKYSIAEQARQFNQIIENALSKLDGV